MNTLNKSTEDKYVYQLDTVEDAESYYAYASEIIRDAIYNKLDDSRDADESHVDIEINRDEKTVTIEGYGPIMNVLYGDSDD